MPLLLVLGLGLSLSTPIPDTPLRQTPAETQQETAAMCSLSGQSAGRQFKTCHYSCGAAGGFSMTVTAREICPFVLNR